MLEDTEQTVNGVTINLSILDFKFFTLIALPNFLSAINLSILDFK